MAEPEGIGEGTAAHQRELLLQRQSCVKLRERVEQTRREKETVVRSCLAGVEAARSQMAQMREELEILRKSPEEAEAEETQIQDEEAELSWRQVKLVECRNLRHELSKWQHQVSTLEGKRPRDEEEVARLKAEVMHAQDVLDSTRHAVRHLEVEQSLPSIEQEAADEDVDVLSPSQKAAHSGVQVLAEKHMREKAEERGLQLASKAKRLGQVLLAQKLLIQRLEKQIAEEELRVDQKELRLAGEERLHTRLKVALRQRSDEIVVDRILGKLSVPQRQKDKVKHAVDEGPSPSN